MSIKSSIQFEKEFKLLGIGWDFYFWKKKISNWIALFFDNLIFLLLSFDDKTLIGVKKGEKTFHNTVVYKYKTERSNLFCR